MLFLDAFQLMQPGLQPEKEDMKKLLEIRHWRTEISMMGSDSHMIKVLNNAELSPLKMMEHAKLQVKANIEEKADYKCFTKKDTVDRKADLAKYWLKRAVACLNKGENWFQLEKEDKGTLCYWKAGTCLASKFKKLDVPDSIDCAKEWHSNLPAGHEDINAPYSWNLNNNMPPQDDKYDSDEEVDEGEDEAEREEGGHCFHDESNDDSGAA